MVISDNQTRWNSVYLSIVRAITLYAKIQVFSEGHKDELEASFLVQADWDVLKWLAASLEPFWAQTQHLQGNARYGHHGAIWEALPTMEYLLEHLEQLRVKTPESEPRLWESVNNAWKKMKKYYELTDKSHQIYAAATLLNPTERMSFFRQKWVGELESWQHVMEATCREVWQQEYAQFARKEEQQKKLTDYEEWRRRDRRSLTGGNEFAQYIMGTDSEGTATEPTENFNPIAWWATATYPSMRQWAFDTLSCPATSCECERVFSSAKKLITPERNKLQDNTIEALECLKAWFDKELIEKEENVH
jgi:hypothetical protein